jgi:hypothetical protein
MAKAKVSSTVTVNVGDLLNRRRVSTNIAGDLIAGALSSFDQVYWRQLQTYQRKMQKAGNDEAARLIPFITRHMMTIRSVKSGVGTTMQGISVEDMESMADQVYRHGIFGTTPRGTLAWRSLSPGWMAKKGFRKPFFQGQSGDLRRQLSQMRSYPTSALGGVEVTLKRGAAKLTGKTQKVDVTRKVLLAQMEFRIFPGAKAAQFPGLASGRWSDALASEQAPGLPANVRSKLSGPTVSQIRDRRRGAMNRRVGSLGNDSRTPFYRPMLTPAAQFWALYRIPLALRIAARAPLSRSIDK